MHAVCCRLLFGRQCCPVVSRVLCISPNGSGTVLKWKVPNERPALREGKVLLSLWSAANWHSPLITFQKISQEVMCLICEMIYSLPCWWQNVPISLMAMWILCVVLCTHFKEYNVLVGRKRVFSNGNGEHSFIHWKQSSVVWKREELIGAAAESSDLNQHSEQRGRSERRDNWGQKSLLQQMGFLNFYFTKERSFCMEVNVRVSNLFDKIFKGLFDRIEVS